MWSRNLNGWGKTSVLRKSPKKKNYYYFSSQRRRILSHKTVCSQSSQQEYGSLAFSDFNEYSYTLQRITFLLSWPFDLISHIWVLYCILLYCIVLHYQYVFVSFLMPSSLLITRNPAVVNFFKKNETNYCSCYRNRSRKKIIQTDCPWNLTRGEWQLISRRNGEPNTSLTFWCYRASVWPKYTFWLKYRHRGGRRLTKEGGNFRSD
jgi:hypothetical protein